MNKEYQFLVRLDGPRPDFRTIIAFLWSDFQNVDSEGNSNNPASRTWTDLHLQNRENSEEIVDITKESTTPLILRISSPFKTMALGVAYFLVHWASGDIYECESKTSINQKLVIDELESTFDLLTRMDRAEKSIWNKSTIEDPYPNLAKA